MQILALYFSLLVGLLGGADRGRHEPTTTLRLKSSVAVRGMHVSLGDLGEFTPSDAHAATLARIRFGPAPVQGHGRVVGRTEIVQALAAAGIDVASLSLQGADEVVVQTVTVEVPATDILEAATAVLQAQLATEGGDVEFEAPARLRHLQAPPGRTSQELRARVRGPRTGPTSAVVDVEVLVDGEPFRSVPVNFRLQRFQAIVKTTGVVRAGTPLGPETLAVVREPLDFASTIYVTQLGQVDGLVAARNLQSGQRLTLGDIAPPALVHKGDIVTVVLTQGRVKVTAKAMANHDAPLGGRITLTNMQSRAQLVGQVHGSGLVVIAQ